MSMNTKTKPPLQAAENEVKQAVETYLLYLENQGKLLYQRNNSFAGVLKRKHKKTGEESEGYIKNNKPGAPDFYVFMRWQKGNMIFQEPGRTIHLELKATNGSQSPEQKTGKKRSKRWGLNTTSSAIWMN
jgi:hypothetical protein